MNRFVFAAVLVMAIAARAATPERGELDASPTLFTVMAAINAAGYDADLSSPNNHPLRDAIRAELAARNIPSLAELKKFFAAHRQKNDTLELSQYISYAIYSSGPPAFELKGRSVEVPPDVEPLSGLGPLLAQFYREARIEDLWNRSQGAFEQYIEFYHEPVLRSVQQVNAYLRHVNSSAEGRHFQIFLDLLGAPNQVQTRSYGPDYYVVVTPSPKPKVEEIRHAYLFHILDPMAMRNADVLNRKKPIIDHALRAPALPEQFKSDFLLLATASLVKAIEARLDKNPALAREALSEGYILTPYFAEQLPVYEKQELALRFYYADLVKAIDLKSEDARLSKVEFAAEARVRIAKTPLPAPVAEPVGAAKTLTDAERFYTARELEKARQAYMNVLQQTGSAAMHAQAYYGLARIAVLENNPELAERLFQKTLQSQPEPPVKAWSLVYLGRLSNATGAREQAARHYQDALAVEGASQAARQAAEQGIQQSLKK